MKILCIGNSFSVDVSTYVHQIAESAGKEIDIYVLYIGGCPIDLHYKNILSGEKAYEFYKNGSRTPLMWCSIQEGIAYQKWDYITFQQVSGKSVDAETFFPELPLLMNEVRKISPGQFLLHKTWAYSKGFSHEKYGKNPMNQEKMAQDIDNAYEMVSSKINVPFIIPSGSAITNRIAQTRHDEIKRLDGFVFAVAVLRIPDDIVEQRRDKQLRRHDLIVP